MRVEYTCLIGVSTAVPALNSTSDMHVTYGMGRTLQIVTQPDCTCFLIYQKLEKPLTGAAALAGSSFTQADADREAAKLANCALTEDINFGELYKRRIRSQLVNLEEVIFEHWHFGRMVLLGDAVHKVVNSHV
jgi:2-polyprenyl-6-methoxyphenol hydroxylase-like FAD-dependent oxidoreductase